MPICRTIARDNAIGKLNFLVTKMIQRLRFARSALLVMTTKEQLQTNGGERRMSTVMWDMFTGSAPYLDIFKRTLDPRFLAEFSWYLVVSFFGLAGRSRSSALKED
jgi:hypothetical protein